MKRLYLQRGMEYRAVTEDIMKEKNFFESIYLEAIHAMDEIIKQSEAYYEAKSSDAQQLMGYSSNVIAFCADRGQGKTSCMVSLATALGKVKQQRPDEFQKWSGQVGNVAKSSYEIINRLDPTLMEENDSILRLILLRMFNQAEEYSRKKDQDGNDAAWKCKRNNLFRLFQTTFQHIDCARSAEPSQNEYDDLDIIARKGNSSNLKEMLLRLFAAYLEFFGHSKQSYLVIQIDDVDLNADKSYEIVEDIRKYLCMPRVIVLLSVNLEQLQANIEQHYIKKFTASISGGGMANVEMCQHMAQQYLQKVIPNIRQMHLPNVSDAIMHNLSDIEIYYYDCPENGVEIDLLAGYGENSNYSLRLLALLQRKTGLIFYKPSQYLHNLLPLSMRDLTHFVHYFTDMPDIELDFGQLKKMHQSNEKTKEQIEQVNQWLENIQKLEAYLLRFWVPLNLRQEARQFLNVLQEETAENKHRTVLAFLPSYYAKECAQAEYIAGHWMKAPDKYRDEFEKLCSNRYGIKFDNGVTEGATYANVNAVLTMLAEQANASRQYKFIYAIRLYYSIYLHYLFLQECLDFQKRNTIIGFIGEGIFSGHELDNITASRTYSEFDLDSKLFMDMLWGDKESDTFVVESYTTFGSFVRLAKRDRKKSWLEPLWRNRPEALLENSLRFGIFHPFLNNIEALDKQNQLDEREWWMSLQMLLNWEQQSKIQKILQINPEISKSNFQLYHWVPEVYRVIGYSTLLGMDNNDSRSENQAKAGLEEIQNPSTLQQVLLAIELSSTKHSEKLLGWLEKSLNEANIEQEDTLATGGSSWLATMSVIHTYVRRQIDDTTEKIWNEKFDDVEFKTPGLEGWYKLTPEQRETMIEIYRRDLVLLRERIDSSIKE